MKKKIIVISVSCVAALLVISAAMICIFVKPEMSVCGNSETTAQVFSDFECDRCTAKFICFDISDKVSTVTDVDTSVLGEYSVEYRLHFHFRDYTLVQKVSVADTQAPVITLVDGEDIIVSSMDFFTEPGYQATDNYDGDMTASVNVEQTVGEDICTLTYTVTDSSGNSAKEVRTVTVKDIVAPVLSLVGEAEITVSDATFSDPGCTADDDLDGDISAFVTVDTDYTERSEGDFVFTYKAADKAGNCAEIKRVLHVRDTVPPIISLNGPSVVYVTRGETYTERGAAATDAFEGDVSSSVVSWDPPDTSKIGTYTVKYYAQDSKGNDAYARRKVVVFDPPTPVSGALNGGGIVSDSTVYLTFDDGPSSNVTPRILDILKANNVKATFFIVNYSEENKAIISRMIAEGHTVAIHGYSHDYGTIYSSVDAFLNNIDTLRQKLINDFGYETDLIRFPGGSSNLVSRSYCPGIMSQLVPLVEKMGYHYFDWNVSSADATGGGVPSSTISYNVTSALRKGRGNVVLMHDASSKSTTADALQSIIDFGYANGYTFAGLSSYSDGAHHSVQN